jgi:uncharacterized membrane-anchored protein
MSWRSGVVLLNLVLVLAWVGLGVWNSENIISHGDQVLFELMPVDPRSLMQGDYMVLRFSVLERPVGFAQRGQLIASFDENRVVTAIRPDDGTRPLAQNELVMRYRHEHRQLWVVSESFFFQEGSGERFAQARYAELRVGSDGTVMLVGLRDAARNLIEAAPAQ